MWHAGVDIHGVDILSNATLRTYMKEYSSWPTFPQLYVDGESGPPRLSVAGAAPLSGERRDSRGGYRRCRCNDSAAAQFAGKHSAAAPARPAAMPAS
jgi:hypothetical protein